MGGVDAGAAKYTAKVMQVYAAMIANMDAQIGTVMETLKQTGRDKIPC